MEENKSFHDKLKIKMDCYARYVYRLSSKFPKHEIYGLTSQVRRSAISVVLNYIEGYARNNKKVDKNFLKISYGSLKESQYVLYFAATEKYIMAEEYREAIKLSDEIGAMLWSTMEKI